MFLKNEIWKNEIINFSDNSLCIFEKYTIIIYNVLLYYYVDRCFSMHHMLVEALNTNG